MPEPITIASGGDIHHDSVSGLGTVGGWLVHPPSGWRFGMSCNHVVAALGHAPLGAPLLQQQRLVGRLHAWTALSTAYYNRADAALFAVPPSAVLTWQHPVPTGTGTPLLANRVYKHGAATGRTTGRIVDVGLDRHFRLRGTPLWFEGIIAIQSDTADPFSNHGDSGALVMDMKTNEAVAVLLAKDEHIAYAYPLQAAHELLGGMRWAV